MSGETNETKSMKRLLGLLLCGFASAVFGASPSFQQTTNIAQFKITSQLTSNNVFTASNNFKTIVTTNFTIQGTNGVNFTWEDGAVPSVQLIQGGTNYGAVMNFSPGTGKGQLQAKQVLANEIHDFDGSALRIQANSNLLVGNWSVSSKLGIGTNDPQSSLHIRDYVDDGTPNVRIDNSGAGAAVLVDTTNQVDVLNLFQFYRNGNFLWAFNINETNAANPNALGFYSESLLDTVFQLHENGDAHLYGDWTIGAGSGYGNVQLYTEGANPGTLNISQATSTPDGWIRWGGQAVMTNLQSETLSAGTATNAIFNRVVALKSNTLYQCSGLMVVGTNTRVRIEFSACPQESSFIGSYYLTNFSANNPMFSQFIRTVGEPCTVAVSQANAVATNAVTISGSVFTGDEITVGISYIAGVNGTATLFRGSWLEFHELERLNP